MTEKQYRYHQVYLKSEHWARTREHMLDKFPRCCLCRKNDSTVVHHLHYHSLGKEQDRDLASVCGPCHEYVHAHRVLEKITNLKDLVSMVRLSRKNPSVLKLPVHISRKQQKLELTVTERVSLSILRASQEARLVRRACNKTNSGRVKHVVRPKKAKNFMTRDYRTMKKNGIGPAGSEPKVAAGGRQHLQLSASPADFVMPSYAEVKKPDWVDP